MKNHKEELEFANKQIAHLKACHEDTSRAFIDAVAKRNAALEDLALVRRERDGLMAVGQKFAQDKERDAETIAQLTRILSQVIGEFNAFQKEAAKQS